MEFANFCGPSYAGRSVIAESDRAINIYPEAVTSPRSQSRYRLIGTPGLSLFSQLNAYAPVRGLYFKGDRCLAVCGERLYEIFSNGNASILGVVMNVATPATFSFNGTQYMIVSGNRGYILNGDTLTQINPLPWIDASGVNLGISHVTFLDQYFVAPQIGTRNVFISNFLDGTTWDPTDYGIKESQPDNVVGVMEDHGELWVFGERSTEVWWDSGAQLFPFQPIASARMETGCANWTTIQHLDNSLFWLTQDDRGNRMVVRAVGYSPRRVSNHAVEYHLNKFASADSFYSWTYAEEGHAFYCISVPSETPSMTATLTWVYDATTGLWHERGYWDSTNALWSPHRAQCHCLAFDKHLVGDRENGMIYEQSLDYNDDNGASIRRIRIAPHLTNEMRYTFYDRFQLDLEIVVSGV